MQLLVAERTRAMGPGTNLHPGDVAHRIYSGLRNYDLDDTIPVWEDSDGIAAFGIIWPKDRAFDMVARVRSDEDDYAAVLTELIGLTATYGPVETEVIGEDKAFADELNSRGFEKVSDGYVFTGQILQPHIEVPESQFMLRSAEMPDVVQLAAVHAGAFGSDWTPESYLRRMQKPGYIALNEIVAVAGDGRFAGFTNTWYDELNKVGYFEPVGVHSEFHRMGVGSVLLHEGMRRMRAAGMTSATVWHAAEDEGATAFYKSNGFEPLNPVARWVSPE
jgi:ribosomal protein S18 acetylase RimI-like enzyme